MKAFSSFLIRFILGQTVEKTPQEGWDRHLV